MKLTLNIPDEAIRKVAEDPGVYLPALLYSFGEALLAELEKHDLIDWEDEIDVQ